MKEHRTVPHRGSQGCSLADARCKPRQHQQDEEEISNQQLWSSECLLLCNIMDAHLINELLGASQRAPITGLTGACLC